MREGEVDRNLLVLRYPTKPTRHAFRRLRHQQRDSRTRWGRKLQGMTPY